MENKILPVIIDLKTCTDDNLYRLVREKLGDNYISLTKSAFKIIYLLDGLDEITIESVKKVCVNLQKLINISTTYKIIISCRSNSFNLIYLKDKFKFEEFSIKELDHDYISQYFNIRKDKIKKGKLDRISKTSELLKDISDIFSIALLWDVIEKIDENTSKIELISMKIKDIIKFDNDRLLIPSYDCFIEINKEIAYIMQENMQLYLTVENLQKIILEKYDRLNYSDVNNIISQLAGAFFETSNIEHESSTLLSYSHRRYQEYFLYLKIKELFFENPIILRKLNLVSNKDFFIGIFVEQGLKDSLDNKAYSNALYFYFLIAYLPESYLKEYRKKKLFNIYSGFGIGEPSYNYSKEFAYALASQNDIKLEYILCDENIDISNFFNNEMRLLEFIEVFHRYNKNKIYTKLIEEFQYIVSKELEKSDSTDIQNIIDNNIYSAIYYCGNILVLTTDALRKQFIERYKYDDSLRISNYENIAYNNEKTARAFLKYMLEFRIDDLISLIPELNNYMFSIWCDEFFKPNNLFLLLSHQNLKEAVLNKLKSIDDYKKFDLSILILGTFLGLKLTAERTNTLEKEWNKINSDARYPRWDERWDYNIILTYALHKKDNLQFNELKAYMSIFEIMINYLQHDINDSAVLRLINEVIENEETSTNWFKYNKSQLIGTILSMISFPTKIEYYLAGNILRYYEKISTLAVLYTIKLNNNEIFKRIVNLELIDHVYNNLSTADEYYGAPRCAISVD